tara:strand:+ start:2234 stop:2617 length:384 start_codon:yes stop_codon:yes gene_type:complete
MAGKGRPKGVSYKRCLIKDERLYPFEIHVDDSTHCYTLYDAKKESNVGYYTQLPFALKKIIKELRVPKDGSTYTLKEYLAEMRMLNDEMKQLFYPDYEKFTKGEFIEEIGEEKGTDVKYYVRKISQK